ncbi:MAG: HAD-IIB family hydrolase [Oligoflexia bacterium]|nr:HAD-IIB family hydrolase [Oligoflexia bacterium]
MTRPADLRTAPREELGRVRAVCLDIDETLSTRGKLTADAYSALWDLKNAGFVVIPITGRPAGWCDHFARFWPVDAVVGENGAFTFFMEGGVRRRLDTPAGADAAMLRARLRGLGERIQARFPQAKWASDQAYREFDLAIDFCEDVPRWPEADVDALLRLCADEGAHAKLSSIHVNAWYGDYDKRRGLEHWLASGAPGLSGEVPAWEELLFIGDSPNDEPLFQAFDLSVGVANLTPFLPRLRTAPRWLTQAESGAGFAELARALIAARGGAGRGPGAGPKENG